jgi:hypothetical protein
MLGAAPSVQAAAVPSAPAPSASRSTTTVLLMADFWDTIDNFMMRYRHWILTMALVVVLFGYFLLYRNKSWK